MQGQNYKCPLCEHWAQRAHKRHLESTRGYFVVGTVGTGIVGFSPIEARTKSNYTSQYQLYQLRSINNNIKPFISAPCALALCQHWAQMAHRGHVESTRGYFVVGTVGTGIVGFSPIEARTKSNYMSQYQLYQLRSINNNIE